MTLRGKKLRLGIKGKVFLIVSATFICFLTISSAVLRYSFDNTMDSLKLTRVEERTAIMGRGIHAQINMVEDSLRLVANFFHMIDRGCLLNNESASLRGRFTNYLNNVRNAFSFFESISVYDEKGRLLYGSEQKFQHGISLKEMRWFKNIEYNDNIVYGYSFILKEQKDGKDAEQNKTLFPIGLALEHEGKKYFISGLIILEKLTDEFLRQDNTLAQTALLIDSKGVVLNSSKQEYKGIRILQSQLSLMKELKFGARRYYPDNMEWYFGFYKIPQTDMYCVIYLYQDRFDALRSDLANKIDYIRLIATFCVTLVAVGIFIPFIRVMRSLTYYLANISTENFKTERIEEKILKRNDELGDFANNLDAMVKRLASLLEYRDKNVKVKNFFMRRMSSEILTSITNITASCQVAKQNCKDILQKNYLQQIEANSMNLFKLVSNIPDFSNYDIESAFIEGEIFSLQDVFSSIKKLFNNKSTQKGVHYNLSINENIPDYIRSNKEHLSQILLNLTHNAIKFTNKGFVHVEIYCEKQQSNTLALHMEIVDSGVGMTEEQIKKIFTAQADKETEQGVISTVPRGLVIVKTIVDVMGGKLSISSKVGEGTSVKVVVPIQEVKLDINKDSYTVFDEDKVFLSALVVQGDKVGLETLQKQLEQANCCVFIATNADEAVKIAKENKIDIAFVDLEMPLMEGNKIVTDILAIPELRNLYIVALSASFSYEDKVRYFEMGIMDCLEKNFSVDTFYLELKKWAESIKGME